MRLAQSALDEAQADRTRMLAAFAVVVGDDGTVAGMMGLPEREVRVARRTVGREGARTVAANLLTRMSDQSADTDGEPVQTAGETTASFPRAEPAAVPASAPPVSPYATAQPSQPTGTYSVPVVEEQIWAEPVQPVPSTQPASPVWSPSMDSVLVWSWHSGLDLQVVANELGLELRTVLQRVQTLAADGQLVKADQVAPRDYSSGSRDHSVPSRDYGNGSREYATGSREYATGSREYSGRHRRHEEPIDFSDTGSFGLGGLFSSASWS
ncbi:hypothetical protein [Streptomyces marianii]|uniref:Uncharacterized protein n=1 Tax=Streptomyces marianii TaxID=1817406 RepID=A0A5R9E444_9ACTN|nr:hypothetical protein [Streptomyces marianii]TLQ44730.1 hypothetical protein FEF34_18005 [Streptomyces marianii]